MDRGEPRYWKVGELAGATGLTVRALHHYDRLGLLVPSQRTHAGHRLYGEADVSRLYHVLALRDLGFSLAEVGELLDGEAPELVTTVRRHLERVERDLLERERLRRRLVGLLAALEHSSEPSVDHFLDALEAMTVIAADVDVVMRVPYEPATEGQPGRRLKTRYRGPKVVLLREREGKRILPIWTGADEGFALVLGLCGERTPRPLAPDLTARLLELARQRVERVVIGAGGENSYVSTLVVALGEESHELDARPSDALNIAARTGAPVLVETDLMDQHAVGSSDELEAKLTNDLAAVANSDAELPGEWRSLTQDLIASLNRADNS